MSTIAGTGPGKILVVDHAPEDRRFVMQALATRSWEIDEADDAPAALTLLGSGRYRAVVLEVELPSMSGITLLREIRAMHDVAVVVRSRCTDPAFAVIAFESGADEFCIKAASQRELTIRVERAVHHHQMDAQDARNHGAAVQDGLEVDTRTRMATLDGTPLDLTMKEFDLLHFLLSSPGVVFTRGELLEQVWATKPDWQSVDTVTEHIYRLRQKLDQDGASRSWIQTIRGAGYRFTPARDEPERRAAS